MKKYYFFIALCATTPAQKIQADEFSRALANYMLAEKDVDTAYRNADPKDRPAMKEQMLRAGIRPEQIEAAQPAKSTAVSAPIAVPVAPPAPPAPKQAETGDLTDTQLQQARSKLKPTTQNAPKEFEPLPGKPRPEELRLGKVNLRKTGLQDN